MIDANIAYTSCVRFKRSAVVCADWEAGELRSTS